MLRGLEEVLSLELRFGSFLEPLGRWGKLPLGPQEMRRGFLK